MGNWMSPKAKDPPAWKKKSSIVFTSAVYGLFISYQANIAVAYERLLYTTVFSGFVIIYLALVLGVFMKKEIDSVLNAVWALYATAAYLALGIFLVARYHHSKNYFGLADGIVAVVTSMVTFIDCIFSSMENKKNE